MGAITSCALNGQGLLVVIEGLLVFVHTPANAAHIQKRVSLWLPVRIPFSGSNKYGQRLLQVIERFTVFAWLGVSRGHRAERDRCVTFTTDSLENFQRLLAKLQCLLPFGNVAVDLADIIKRVSFRQLPSAFAGKFDRVLVVVQRFANVAEQVKHAADKGFRSRFEPAIPQRRCQGKCLIEVSERGPVFI